jgi:hypothetical protein
MNGMPAGGSGRAHNHPITANRAAAVVDNATVFIRWSEDRRRKLSAAPIKGTAMSSHGIIQVCIMTFLPPKKVASLPRTTEGADDRWSADTTDGGVARVGRASSR